MKFKLNNLILLEKVKVAFPRERSTFILRIKF